MPMSVTGELPFIRLYQVRMRSKGFTLIELLVVMVIIGITIALIAPNFLPDDLARIRGEAQTTGLRLQYAYRYAESTGRPIAWVAKDNRSMFQELDETGRWQIVTDNPQFPQSILPAEMIWTGLSRLLFVPGEAAPAFEVQLSLHNKVVQLKGDALGKVIQTTIHEERAQ